MQPTVTMRLKADATDLKRGASDGKKAVEDLGNSGTRGARGLRDLGNQADRSGRSVDSLGAASRRTGNFIRTMIGAAVVRQAVQLADQYINIQSRLELVTKSEERYAAARDQSYAIAQRTYSALESTATLYGRMQQSTDALGRSQQEALRTTELINKTFQISGTEAATANAAIIQLSQGLSAGALRGDEFNSVMEGAPRLADALGASLGKTRGELRAMAEEGQITADVIIDAILRQGDVIDAEFARMEVTAGRGWQNIVNAATRSIGELSQRFGATEAIGATFQAIASGIERLPQATEIWVDALMPGVDALRDLAGYVDDFINRFVPAKGALGEFFGELDEGRSLWTRFVEELGILPVSLGTIVTIAIGELDKLRISGIEKFRLLMIGGEEAWLGLKAGVSALGGSIKLVLGGAVDAVMERFSGLVTRAAGMANAIGADALSSRLVALATDLQGVANQEATIRAEIERNAAAYDAERARLDARRAQISATAAVQRAAADDAIQASLDEREAALTQLRAERQLADASTEATTRTKANTAATKADEAARKNHEQSIRAQAKALKEQIDALRILEALIERGSGVSEAMLQATEENRRELDAFNDAMDVLLRNGPPNEAIQLKIAAAYDAVTAAARRRINEAEREDDIVGNLRAEYEQQIHLLGLSNEARRVEETILRVLHGEREKLLAMAPEERDAEEARIRATVEWGEAQMTALEKAEDAGRAMRDEISAFSQAAAEGTDAVADYFSNLWKRIKASFIQSGITSLLSRLFGGMTGGGGGWASMLNGLMGGSSGGGGGTSMFGQLFSAKSWASAGKSLFGGFSQMFGGAGNVSALQSYGVLNTPTGYAGGFAGHGGLAGWGGAAAGALYGMRRGDGGLGTVGSTIAGGVAGYYAGGVAMGAMAGGMAGAGAALAAIPVAGWIAAAAIIIDKISGGKLFGTKYRPESSTSTLALGAEGGTASASLTEVRNRSLFRGRKWTTNAVDPGNEARDAAAALYEAIHGTMADAARALAVDTPPMIDAAIRTVTEYDKKGRATATKIFVDAVGRSWEEATAELAASRISSEALISTIDAALGTQVQAVAEATVGAMIAGANARIAHINGPIDYTLPEYGGGGPGVGAGPSTPQPMGEASAIAERWRHDVELLAQGAQFLLVAATDIQHGVGLLEGGTLTQITDLIEDLGVGSETLVETYARVATSAALLDQVLSMSGVQIDGTREHIVRLATAITDAAGGLDAAQALWSSYFANFYTEAERAAYGRTQMQASASAAFAGTGLDLADYLDTGGLARFREQFEAAMPTMSAEDIATWLRAADALAAITASAREIDASIEANAWSLYLDGLTDSQRAIAESTRYYDDWTASATAAGATSAQLAAIEEQRAVAMGWLLAAQAEARAQAEADYQAAVGDIRDMLDARRMSEFAASMREIGRWSASTTASLHDAARAAGRQSAAEEDLALVHEEAAARAAEAIAALRESMVENAVALGYIDAPDTLDYLNQRITELQNASASAADGIGQAVDAMRNQMDLLLGDLSPYSDRQKLEMARAGLQQGSVTQEQFLQVAQRLFGHTSRYAEEFNFAMRYPGQSSAGTAPDGHSASSSADKRGLAELIAARDALLAQREYDTGQTLARQLAEMSAATSSSYTDIAQSMGWDLAQLADTLSLSDEALTGYLDTLSARYLADTATAGAGSASIVDAIQQSTADLIAAIMGSYNAGDYTGEDVGAGGAAVQPEVIPVANVQPVASGDTPLTAELAALRAAVAEMRAELAALREQAGRSADADEATADATAQIAVNTGATVNELVRLGRARPGAQRSMVGA